MTGDATRVGLLHTVPALAEAFDRRIADAAPGAERVHVVEASLLQTAIDVGVTDEVRARVRKHLRDLVADGADAVLVTCSSIGEAAEEAAAELGVPVVRVDAAMAREAASIAAAGRGRLLVLATNTATLGPTGRLVERAARDAGAEVRVEPHVVEGAAAARAGGDAARHDRLIADAVRRGATEGADAIVLAQASMADAAADAGVGIPVLTSPAGGVAELVARLRERS
jgi:aspartate/glutamate racemase